jgi:hypothetical protein
LQSVPAVNGFVDDGTAIVRHRRMGAMACPIQTKPLSQPMNVHGCQYIMPINRPSI